jgi:hypothetical protein
MGKQSNHQKVNWHHTIQLVYGTEVVFPAQLAIHVANFLQDQEGEHDDMIMRMHQLVEVQQTKEQLFDKAQSHQQKIKDVFDKKVKKEYFQLGDLVLKWDAQRQDKGKSMLYISSQGKYRRGSGM